MGNLDSQFVKLDNNKVFLPLIVKIIGNEIMMDLTLVKEKTEVKIVDVLGKTIIEKILAGNSTHQFKINSRSPIFIVNAKTKNASRTCKVFAN